MPAATQRILLLNPPHSAIGSRIPREQLPPLGLLSVGGPLIDAGFAVRLLDAEFGPMPMPTLSTRRWPPRLPSSGARTPALVYPICRCQTVCLTRARRLLPCRRALLAQNHSAGTGDSGGSVAYSTASS